MLKEFQGDYRIIRIISTSSDPMETIHKFNTGYYSIRTLLDMFEVMDIQDTIKEDDEYLAEKKKSRDEKRK